MKAVEMENRLLTCLLSKNIYGMHWPGSRGALRLRIELQDKASRNATKPLVE
jgi:hypothetical protein